MIYLLVNGPRNLHVDTNYWYWNGRFCHVLLYKDMLVRVAMTNTILDSQIKRLLQSWQSLIYLVVSLHGSTSII
jgi:hypothetical protein